MWAAVMVVRELLRCRLLESSHDTLLERVAKLMYATCRGASPFCTLPMKQAVVGALAHP